jgi:hypothetical protein
MDEPTFDLEDLPDLRTAIEDMRPAPARFMELRGTLTISAHYSDADLARGFVQREVRPDQLEEFARLLLNIAAKQKQRTRAARPTCVCCGTAWPHEPSSERCTTPAAAGGVA